MGLDIKYIFISYRILIKTNRQDHTNMKVPKSTQQGKHVNNLTFSWLLKLWSLVVVQNVMELKEIL